MKMLPIDVYEKMENQGIRPLDLLILRPLSGPVKTIPLVRKFYNIGLSKEIKEHDPQFISLDYLEGDCFDLTISIRDDGRFYSLTSNNGRPFNINGHYSYSALLTNRDKVFIGHNELLFQRKEKRLIKGGCEHDLPIEYAKSDLPLLIEGETGTGKSSLARWVHENRQSTGKFVHLNLSSFSPQLLESELFGHVKGAFTGASQNVKGALLDSHRGTLFLDEIDSLPKEIQVKLLLFLDHHRVRPVGGTSEFKVETKIIFASGRSLISLLENDLFRKDFYFRLMGGLFYRLKPLRENRRHIEYFCQLFQEEHGVHIDKKLIEIYKDAPWVGNYRQLQSHLMRKKIMSKGNHISFDSFDEQVCFKESSVFNYKEDIVEVMSLENCKKKYAKEVFYRLNKRVELTAKALEISPKTLKRLIEQSA